MPIIPAAFLFEQVQLKDKQIQSIIDGQEEIKEELERLRLENDSEQKRLLAKNDELTKMLSSANADYKLLQKTIEDLTNLLSLVNKEHYGSKSQKGITKRKSIKGKNDGRDDFDGTDE